MGKNKASAAYYSKTIIIENEAKEKIGVVIFDEKLHLPVIYGVNRFGMDDVLELFNSQTKEEDGHIPG